MLSPTLSRFRRLGPDTQRLLQLGSLADGHLAHRLLRRVFGEVARPNGCFDTAVAEALDSRFLRYDALGTCVYATLWVVLGHLFGDELLTVLEWVGRRHLLVAIVPVGVAAIFAYRVWRRRKHGAARAMATAGLESCPPSTMVTTSTPGPPERKEHP